MISMQRPSQKKKEKKVSYYQTFALISELNRDYKPEIVIFPVANFGKF